MTSEIKSQLSPNRPVLAAADLDQTRQNENSASKLSCGDASSVLSPVDHLFASKSGTKAPRVQTRPPSPQFSAIAAAASTELPLPPPNPFNFSCVARYGDYTEVHLLTRQGIEARNHGNLTQAFLLWGQVVANSDSVVRWREGTVANLATSCEAALTKSNDPANTSEAMIEAGLALQETDRPRAIAIFKVLAKHVDLLFPTSRPAPSYNFACCYFEEQSSASNVDLNQGMHHLLDSMSVSLRLNDRDDLDATQELLQRTDGSLRCLHIERKDWIRKVASVIGRAAPEGYDAEVLVRDLEPLRAQVEQ